MGIPPDLGTGADGAYNPGSSTTLPDGTYNYTSVNIASGIVITFSNVIIKCTGTVTIDGSLNGDSQGSAGGPANYVYQGHGQDGQGTGKGGGGSGCRVGWCTASGGGGAGYGSVGTAGTVGDGYCAFPGYAGISFGDIQLSSINLGSGGGAGGYQAEPGRYGGAGGYGGGAIKIMARNFVLTGGIYARGGNGGAGAYAGGGGGSGGTIWVRTDKLIATGGSILATGGSGGSNTKSGGAGGVGRIRLDYNTLTDGTISPANGYTDTSDYVMSSSAIFFGMNT